MCGANSRNQRRAAGDATALGGRREFLARPPRRLLGGVLLAWMAACDRGAPTSTAEAPTARAIAVDVTGVSPRPAAPGGGPLPDGRDPLAPAWVQALRHDAIPSSACERLFREASDASGPLEAGLLLCRVEALPGHTWDPGVGNALSLGFARDEAPDMAITVSVDGAAESVRLGEDDRAVAHVAFPGVTLRPGAGVRVRVFDRDVAQHDFMGDAHGVWRGRWPLTLRAPTFVATCRPAPDPVVRRGAAAPLASFDREATALRRSLAQATSFAPTMVPEARFAAGRRALAGAASWLGWSHPELRARAAQSQSLDDLMREALRDALRRVRAPGADQTIATDSGLITLRGTRCDLRVAGEAVGCAAVLAVTPRTALAAHGGLARVTLYAAQDAPWSLHRCMASGDDGRTWRADCELTPGSPALLAYAGADPPSAVPSPAVLDVSLFFSREPVRFRLDR